MSRWPLLWQIVFRNVVATALVCLAFGVIAYAALFRYTLAAVDTELLSEAIETRQLIDEVGKLRIFSASRLGREEDAGLAAEGVYVKIYSPDGGLIDQSSNAATLEITPPRWMFEYAHAGQPVHGTVHPRDGKTMRAILYPVFRRGRLWFLIFCCQSTQPIERALRSFYQGLLAMAPIILLIALGASWLSARSSLAPFKRLAADLSRITASSLTSPLPVRGTGDELDQVVSAFNELMARLARAFEHLQQFANEAAHQLRTPLTVLRGEIELALERGQSADDYKAALERAAREVARLEKLVNSLLLLSKLERHELPGELVELDSVLHKVAAAASADRCPAHISAPPQPLLVIGDAQLIEQMLFNPLDNACRYAASQVQVRAWRDDHRVFVEIVDDGPGMSDEEMQRAGTPFFRGAAAQGTDGSGLGLAVAMRIAQAFGGEITIRCPDGGGTIVTVSMPAAEPSDDD